MRKLRWLSWLLTIAMLLTMIPFSAYAEGDFAASDHVHDHVHADEVEMTEVPVQEVEPTETPMSAPKREIRSDGKWVGTYLACDENGKNWVTKTCTEGATVLTSTMTAWNAGWYVASGAVTFDSDITVTGDVKLILEDGATLTAGNRIYVTEGNSLTVYAQSTGDSMGKLVGQRIGAKADKGGTLTFNGGRLTFKTGTPIKLSEGSLTVNGGYVEAASTSDVAIGSDTVNYRMGTVTINGGTLIATTTDENYYAIGHYWNTQGSPAVLNINGGTLIASSDNGVIHSSAIINLNADYDCRISLGASEGTATVQEYSARKVDRDAKYLKIEPCEKHAAITGVSYRTAEGHVVDGCRFCGKGTTEAHSYDAETNLCICGAWKGSYQACDENGRNWETKEISGVRVLTNAEWLRDGGIYVLCGDTTFSGTDSVRIQKDLTLILADGANITADGGLRVNEAGSLTIYAQSAGDNMGKLTANGGYMAAGIGGNSSDAPGPIKIYGGEINANGGAEAAGIGGATYCAGGELTIYGGKVTAIGYQYTPGIGGGESYEGTNAGGTVTIYGGTVIAKGCGGARSIGSAYGYIRFGTNPGHTGGSGGTLTLNGGTLYLLRGWGDIEETDICYRAPQILEAAPNFSTEVGWLQSFGTNENDLVPIYAGDLTGEEYTSYAAAKFEVCPHDPNAGAEYIDEQTHAASCTWCGMAMGSTTAHIFDENGNCACGAWQATVLDCDENGENWTTKTVVGKNRLEAPESGTVVTLDAGWYIASDALTLGDENTDFTVQLNGDVKLLLRDGNSITVNGTIESTDANGTLTVYGQSAGDGKGDLFVNGRIDSDLVVKGGNVVVNKPDGFAAAGEAGTIYGPLNGSFTLIGGTVTVLAMNEDTVLPKFVPTMVGGAGLKFSGGATMGELASVAASDFAALTDYRAYRVVRFEVCTDHMADESNANYPVKVDNAQHKSICKWCGNEYLAAHVYDATDRCECGALGVNYRVYNETSKKWEQKQCNDFTFVTSDTVSWQDGWYVVAGSVSITESVYMVGDVHLILRDNASLWIAKGIISQFSGSTLTIYAQSAPSIGEDGSISNGSVGTLRVESSDADMMDGGYGISCDGGLTVMGGILDIEGTYNAIRYKLNAYGGRIEAEVDQFKSAFGETPELCGDAGWVVRNGDGIDYVTAVEHSKLTAESYQTCAVVLDPCSPHEYLEECVYVDSTRHGYSCKWCGVMNYELHAYTEVKPSGYYSPYYEPCTCGAWKGSYSDFFNDADTVNVEGVRPLTAKDTVWTAGTYAVCGDMTFDSRVTVSGNVTIILTRTANLTVNGGIEVNDNSEAETVNTNALTFFKDYSSYQSISKLTVQNVPAHCAGIGGGDGKTAGRIRFSEGYYDITGGEGAPGVGGGYGGGTGKILIADIKAAVIRGGEGAVGIGAGVGGTPEAVNIAVNSNSLIVSGVTAFDIAPSIGSKVNWLMISAGDSADTLTKQTKKDGIAALTTAKAIKMEVCDHAPDGTAYTFLDKYEHYWYCSYCEDFGTRGDHAYDETTHVCACGKIWSNGTDKAYVVSAGESLKTDYTNIILEDMTFGTPEEPVLLELKTKLILGDGVTVTVNGSIKAYDSEITALSYGENMGKLIVQNVPEYMNGILIVANKTLKVSGGDITVSAGKAEGAIGTEIEEGVFLYAGGRVTALSSSETSGGWFAFELDPTINMPYRLYAGDTVDSLELIAEPYREDFSFSHSADVVRLDEPCKSHNYSRDLYYYKDENYHLTTCFDCGASFEEYHAFGADNVCVCGYANGVKYLDYDFWGEKWTTESYTGVATLITPYTTKLNGTWCIVRGDVTIGTPTEPVIIPLNCAVELILLDGASLTIYGSLQLQETGSYLSVEAQSTGSDMGKLTIKAPKNYPAFGGKSAHFPSEDYAGVINLYIYGGELDLTGGSDQPAICGGDPYSSRTEDSYSLYVYGGKTTARGGYGKEAIGHQCYTYDYRDYYFEMYGGEFTAIGGEGACALADYKDGCISLSGGKLTAEGGSGKAAFAAIPDVYCEDWAIYVGNSIAALKAPLGPNDRDLELCKTQTAVRLEECVEHNYGPSYSDQSTHNIMCLNCAKLQESAVAHTFDEETGLCVCGAWKGTYLTYDPETELWSTSEPVVARSVNSADYQWTEGWYVVKGDVTIDRRMIVSGHVRLILADNSSLTVNGGISLIRNHTLTIYAQSTGEHMGSLTAQNAPHDCAGIGGNECLEDMTDFLYGPNNGMYGSSGDLNIYGGRITATAGGWAAGIGDGAYPGGYEPGGSARSGDITIYGGVVTATGGGVAPGIGTLTYVDWNYVLEGAKIAIYGGTVNAYGGSHPQNSRDYIPGVGIGGVDLGSVIIYGGTVNAYGGVNLNGKVAPAAGIGSMITDKALSVVIKGGTLTSVSGEGGKAFDSVPTMAEGAWAIYVGTSESDLSLVAQEDRTDALYTSNCVVRIMECVAHSGNVTYTDPMGHTVGCTLCGEATKVAHVFDESNGTCICGAVKTSYLECDADGKNWKTVENVGALPFAVNGDQPTLTTGWYVLSGNVSFGTAGAANRLTISGDVKIILADGCSLNAASGIEVPSGSSLTIYAQSDGNDMGSLTARSAISGAPAIGAFGGNAGTISVKGGSVTADGNGGGAGIGAGSGYGATVNLYGGTVNASGASNAPAIGGGGAAADKALNVNIYGGTVNVYGGENAVAIGNGSGYDDADQTTKITISGGKITALAGAAQNAESPTCAFSVEPTLRLSGYLCSVGASLEVLANVPADSFTAKVFTENAAVRLVPCEHPVGYSKLGESIDDVKHARYCPYCNESITEQHSFPTESNGICACGGYQPAVRNTNGDYEIGNAGQFLWFGAKINSGEKSINGKLIADISLKNVAYVPIAEAYGGIFDGAEHTISDMTIVTNAYVSEGAEQSERYGLFGKLGANAVLKNFTLRGSITCVSAPERVGGAAGYVTDGATVENVHSYVNISDGGTKFEGTQYIGGVVGYCFDQDVTTTVKNCTYHGTINMTYAARVGGISGHAGSNSRTIGCVNYGTVKVGGGYHTGGIAGGAQNALVEHCMNYGTVEMKSHDCLGGIVGYATGTTNIVNCGNIGAITGTSTNAGAPNAYVGGILGYINNSDFGGVSNCYNYGTLTAYAQNTYCGAIIGWGRSGAVAARLKNNYYLKGTKAYGATNDTTVTATEASAEQFASGEVAYQLNGGVTNGTQAWYQELTDEAKKDAYPVMNGKTVYYGYRDCLDEEMHYANTPLTKTKGEHRYDNGFCTVCDVYQPASLNAGTYEIGNAGQLYWFAALVNGTLETVEQNKAANGRLTANITVNRNVLVNGALSSKSATFRTWTPIGNSVANAYSGSFDGNGKTVSGLYFDDSTVDNVGLFGRLDKGTLQNVGVIDSWLSGKNYVGGVAANVEAVSGSNRTISGCYHTGVVKGTGYVGGVVGCVHTRYTLSRCYNSGTVYGSGSNIGGVTGYCYTGSIIENCYNIGAVYGSGNNNGGVVGWQVNGTVRNCYNTGAISGKSYTGGVIGRWLQGSTSGCYYQTGCAVDGSGTVQNGIGQSQQQTATADTAGKTTAKTESQFASGEVAWLMNDGKTDGTQIWFQTIGTDPSPRFSGQTVCRSSDGDYYNGAILNALEITWSSMEFTYSDGAWDPDTHDYGTVGWTTTGGTVTVRNAGTETVNVALSFTPVLTGLTGTLSKTAMTLAARESDSASLMLSGTPAQGMTRALIGTVSITITDPTRKSN